MKKLITSNKLLFIYLLLIIILSLIFTTFEYMGFSYNLLTTILLFINFILIFIYAFKNAKKSNLKGYKSGIKSGLKLISLYLILNIITFSSINFKGIIYYIITLFISISGGIIGKNKQKNYSS